jgi:lipopolysaccharide/colanic/teichoic acid biosynthesis glycosyltransferase
MSREMRVSGHGAARHVNPRFAAADRYLRRPSSALALLIRLIAPYSGAGYTRSRIKRFLDLSIGVPALALAAVPMLLLVLLNKLLHPTLPALFVQERVGHGGPLKVMKIRSMAQDSPGLTTFARLLRRHKLDELPQLVQVVSGDLSLVGIRILPYEIYQDLRQAWSPERFARWSEAYASTPLGLAGFHQVIQGRAKRDRARFHRDMLYVRRATLGLDLYLLWRTALRILDPPPPDSGRLDT